MKMKSHSGLKKRVKISGTGKVMFCKPCKKHLLINKSKRQKSLNRGGQEAHVTDMNKLKRLLPHSF